MMLHFWLDMVHLSAPQGQNISFPTLLHLEYQYRDTVAFKQHTVSSLFDVIVHPLPIADSIKLVMFGHMFFICVSLMTFILKSI